MAADKVVLLDIPTKAPRACWSLNPWKIRLALNYMGVDYETEWVEYADIKPRLEQHVEPNPGKISYTIPTVKFPDGKYVMDSLAIAKELQARYPDAPPLGLDSPYVQRISDALGRMGPSIFPVICHRVPTRLLSDASADYFFASRQGWTGKPTEQLHSENPVGASLARVADVLGEVSAMYRENPGGPFLMGEQVGFADFVWIGMLLFFRKIGDDVLEPLLENTGDREVHLQLLEAARSWTERDAF